VTTHSTAKSDDAVGALCKQRIQGLTAYAGSVASISAKGTPYTPATLIALYQKCIDTRTALAAVRAQEVAALAARVSADAARKAVDASVLAWAVETFGPTSPQAQAFGYVEPNPAKPTAETRAKAVVKAKATRAARGTKGKKQKAQITGSAEAPAAVVGPTPTPTNPTPTSTK